MRRLAVVCALLAALPPAAARAADFTLGARSGWAFGWGDVGGTLPMSDWTSSQVPLQADALYRVNPRLGLGVYFSYGFAQTAGAASDLCADAGNACSVNGRRLGVLATYALAPHGRVEPWIGGNIGYEWSSLEFTQPGGKVTIDFKGWEYLGVQGGADWRLGARVAAGPFLHASFGRYGEGDLSGQGDLAGVLTGASVDEKKLHGWITLGARIRFDL